MFSGVSQRERKSYIVRHMRLRLRWRMINLMNDCKAVKCYEAVDLLLS